MKITKKELLCLADSHECTAVSYEQQATLAGGDWQKACLKSAGRYQRRATELRRIAKLPGSRSIA